MTSFIRHALLFAALILAGSSLFAANRDEWFSGLDLEPAIANSELILVVRIADITEQKIVFGGKGESSTQQFIFKPLRTLKGVFTRPELSLTSNDLGIYRFSRDGAKLNVNDVRVLFLQRSEIGYHNAATTSNLDHALPPLADENDPLIPAVQALIKVSEQHDRLEKIALLVPALNSASGAPAIPLLNSLKRRALLAAQVPDIERACAKHLESKWPAVREATALSLQALLENTYFDSDKLREFAAGSLSKALDRADPNVTARCSELLALGATSLPEVAQKHLAIEKTADTFQEEAAKITAIGALKIADRQSSIVAELQRTPLDGPAFFETAMLRALVRLAPEEAASQMSARAKRELAAGLHIVVENEIAGELPPPVAVPLLLEFEKGSLNLNERIAFVSSCLEVAKKEPDARLVLPLSKMLDPREPQVRSIAIDALLLIDTPDSAKALQPHLREEMQIARKLEIAAMLGRHGIADGYPYAMEHMSDPALRDAAVDALAAIRAPKAPAELRHILETSNDPNWNAAAIRALGALGEKELTPRLLELASDLKNPLAPAALIALGDLAEPKALPSVREGLASRNDEVVAASARAAGKLLAIQNDDAIRDRLAELGSDRDVSQSIREKALDSLMALKDARLDQTLIAIARDARLEQTAILERVERLLRERKVKTEP